MTPPKAAQPTMVDWITGNTDSQGAAMGTAIVNTLRAGKETWRTKFTRRNAPLAAALMMLASCARTSPSTLDPAATVDRAEASDRVVAIRGFLVGEASSDAPREPLRSRASVNGCSAEL